MVYNNLVWSDEFDVALNATNWHHQNAPSSLVEDGLTVKYSIIPTNFSNLSQTLVF
jgi:hypothetical protein